MKKEMMGGSGISWTTCEQCTLLQTDNHTSTSPLSFYSQMPLMPPNQQHQSTEGKR